MEKVRRFLPFVIFFLTCLLVLSYGNFCWDIFLLDDNICQWYPVTEKAYEHLFLTGSIPSYNFFLLNGFPIANMGYYSLYNPIMLISYLLERILPFNMFAINICILCGLGNVFFFLFCRTKKICVEHSLLFTLAYSSSACYIAFQQWYYVFNNYFSLPLLFISVFSKDKSRISYISSGVILAFDLLLGNVQYVFFHYIIYIVLMFGLQFIHKSVYLRKLVTNLTVAILLSAPILLLGVKTSTNMGKGLFLNDPVTTFSFFISSFTPFHLDHPFLPTIRFDFFLEYAAPLTISFLVGGVYAFYQYILYCKRKKLIFLTTEKEKFLVFALVLFWLNYNEGGFIAQLMSCAPVVSHFTYLYKAYFVLMPLLALWLTYNDGLFISRKFKILIVLLSILGIANNFYVYNNTRMRFVPDNEHYSKSLDVGEVNNKLSSLDILYDSYRIVSFYSDNNISKDKFLFTYSLSRNYPAYLGVFSIAAYENAAPRSRIDKINRIYSDDELMTYYGNTGIKSYFLKNLEHAPSELEKQLRSNSVKYLLIKRDSIIPLDTLIHKMNLLKTVYVEKTANFNDLFDLVVLGGIPSLCRFGDSIDVPLQTIQMDLLSFNADSFGDYVLSFAHENELSAYYIDNKGKQESLELTKDRAGNTRILDVPQGKTVYLTYNDPLCRWAKLLEIVISILFVIVLFAMFKLKGCALKC